MSTTVTRCLNNMAYISGNNYGDVLWWAGKIITPGTTRVRILNCIPITAPTSSSLPIERWAEQAEVELIVPYKPADKKKEKLVAALQGFKGRVSAYLLSPEEIDKTRVNQPERVNMLPDTNPDCWLEAGFVHVEYPQQLCLTQRGFLPNALYMEQSKRADGQISDVYEIHQKMFEQLKGLSEKVR